MNVKDYEAILDNRTELGTGSVRYDLQVVKDVDGDGEKEVIVDTTYTVSKRQEDPDAPGKDLKQMVKEFTKKKAEEHEQGLGRDYSGERISL